MSADIDALESLWSWCINFSHKVNYIFIDLSEIKLGKALRKHSPQGKTQPQFLEAVHQW